MSSFSLYKVFYILCLIQFKQKILSFCALYLFILYIVFVPYICYNNTIKKRKRGQKMKAGDKIIYGVQDPENLIECTFKKCEITPIGEVIIYADCEGGTIVAPWEMFKKHSRNAPPWSVSRGMVPRL